MSVNSCTSLYRVTVLYRCTEPVLIPVFQERSWVEHSSVAASRRAATEPITLAKCLEAFTQEEELGEEDKIYCAKCK